MIFLRNRLADYEVYVANLLPEARGLCRLDRPGTLCIENYDGAPAIKEALQIMIASYDGLGLKDLAERSQEVFALNYPNGDPNEEEERRLVALKSDQDSPGR